MFQQLVVPAFICAGAAIVARNRAANGLLGKHLHVHQARGDLVFAETGAQALFRAVSGGDKATGCALLGRETPKPALLQIHALGPFSPPLANNVRVTAVLISPLGEAGAMRRRVIQSYGELSRAEQNVLAALVSGRSVDEIAASNGRSVETVRWHVKSMLKKTGARSIADLTRIGALFAPF